MPTLLINLLALVVPVVPLAAIQWNFAGRGRRRRTVLAPGQRESWRMEIYSNSDQVGRLLVDPADIPFPVKVVRSARGELALAEQSRSWSLPQVELELAVDQPFADDVLDGLFGGAQRIRFVTGSESSVDVDGARLRVRALPMDRS